MKIKETILYNIVGKEQAERIAKSGKIKVDIDNLNNKDETKYMIVAEIEPNA